MVFRSKTDMRFKNKTEQYFYDLSYRCYLSGYPNLWVKELPFSKTFDKYHSITGKIIDILITIVILMEYGALFTQTNLTEKQKSDLYTRCLVHPMLWMCRNVIIFYSEDVTKLYNDIFNMKDIYNDRDLEQKMIKKATTLSNMLKTGGYMSTVLHLFSNAVWSIRTGDPMMGLCTAWPLMDDRSTAADVGRGISIVLWCLLTDRMIGAFCVIASLNSVMSYQFRNLRSYFLSLENYFHMKIDQTEMEKKYIEGFLTGIKLHNDTISCTRKCYDIFKSILIGVNIYTMTVQVSLTMNLVKSERTFANLIATVFTAAASYSLAGIMVCSTGNIAVEASKLDSGIFGSGWHNCRKEALRRVKGLVMITMCRAQESLVFTAFGFIDISYETYIKMVKTSYSVFSFLYTVDPK